MDSIDITDSAFSLGIPDVNAVISTGGGLNDYTMFIYIGAAILVAFIAMFVYKFYNNKQFADDSHLDCPGGFCNRPPSTSQL